VISLFKREKILYHYLKRAEIAPLFGAPCVMKKKG